MILILNESSVLLLIGDTWPSIIFCISAEFVPSSNCLLKFPGILIFSFTLNVVFMEIFMILIYHLFSFYAIIFLNNDELELWYRNPIYWLFQLIFSTNYNCCVDSRQQDVLLGLCLFHLWVHCNFYYLYSFTYWTYNWNSRNMVIGGYSSFAGTLELWFFSALHATECLFHTISHAYMQLLSYKRYIFMILYLF